MEHFVSLRLRKFGIVLVEQYFDLCYNNPQVPVSSYLLLMHHLTNRGLAFSPSNKYMYLSYQGEAVYEFWREDGLPFNGTVADTKYHSTA